MNIRWLIGSTIGLSVVSLITSASIGIGLAVAAPARCVSWTGSQPANPSSTGDVLAAVGVPSACNAWAVGYDHGSASNQTLAEHWNGTLWTHVPSASPAGSSGDSFLTGVTATSSASAWAVGQYFKGGAIGQTLIERWNGAAWVQVHSPNPSGPASTDILTAVAASSSRNVWAVGSYQNGAAIQTLVVHWNGASWRHIASPNPKSNDSTLTGVAVVSARVAWAVGQYFDGTAYRTLIERWNGTVWKLVPSPNVGGATRSNNLSAVSATSPVDAWAVGHYSNGTTQQTLIEHWNGSVWKRVRSPNPGGSSNYNALNGVVAPSAGNAWAVGAYYVGTSSRNLIEHWNGATWRHVSATNLGSFDQLSWVAAS